MIFTDNVELLRLLSYVSATVTISTNEKRMKMNGERVVGRKIDHVGIAVGDMGEAVARYQLLGFQIVHEETNKDQGVREVMMALPGDSTQIQLLAPLDEASPIARFLDKRGPGLQQLAIEVDDVRLAAQQLSEQGRQLVYDEPKRGTSDSLVNFVHPSSAGGVLIELVERTL